MPGSVYNDDTDIAGGAAAQDLLDPKKLSKMGLAQLEDMRKGAPQNVQDQVAPYAHRAFTRMVAEDNLPGAAATAVAIPAYTAAKALGLMGSRSKPSLEEIKQGYVGLGEGLKKRFGGK